jgi:nucleotide-binding universal stress UspA family protein
MVLPVGGGGRRNSTLRRAPLALVDAAWCGPNWGRMTKARATDPGAGPIILCYDGSQEALEAIAYAAALLPGTRALVVTVWKPISEEGLSPATKPPAVDPADLNEEQRLAARQLANHGAKKASAAGLKAEPLAVETTGRVWQAIELVAEEQDARLIVCGTRRTGMTAILPGHLASALVDHASVPVLVVPSPAAAEERRRELRDRHGLRHRVDAGTVPAAAVSR